MMPRNMLEAITAASANPAASQETGSESHENGGGEGRQARRYSQASRPPTFRGCLTIKSMGGVKTTTVVKELSIDINGKRIVVRKRPPQTGKKLSGIPLYSPGCGARIGRSPFYIDGSGSRVCGVVLGYV